LLDYDASKLHKSIAYLAANDLYGWAMSRPLPKKGSIWRRVLPKEEEVLTPHTHTAGQKELPGSLPKPAVLSQVGNASGA